MRPISSSAASLFALTGQDAWANATEDQRTELIQNLRGILQLSVDASIEDINRVLLELDSRTSRTSLTALASSLHSRSVFTASDRQVCERLGISRDRWNKYAA